MRSENQNALPIAPTESDSIQQPSLPSSSNNHTEPSRELSNSFWMTIRNRLASNTSPLASLPAGLRHWYIGYLIAIILQVLVVSLIALLIHLYSPFSFLEAPALLVVVFLALSWGIGPGLVGTLIGAILFDILVFPPYLSFTVHRTEDITGIFLYLLVSLAICLMARQTQHAQQQTRSSKNETLTLQHQLHELYMQTPTPITVLRGPEHRFELINPLTQRFVGNRQILGLPIREAIPEYADQGIIDLLDRVYTTGEPITILELHAEIQQRTGNLSTQAEGYFNVVYQPTRTPEGEVDGIFVFNIEVTEQVRARQQMEKLVQELNHERARLREFLQREQSLREAAENASLQLQAIFEAIADPVFIVGAEGPRRMNHAARKLLGIPENVHTGELHAHSRFFELHDEQGQILPREAWPQTKILAGSALYGSTAADVVIHTTNDILHLSVTGAPLKSETGDITAAVLVCRDVTERRRLDQRLRQAEQIAAERANQLEAVFEAMTDGVFILDIHNTNPQLNSAARGLLDITEDVIVDSRQGAPFDLLDEQGQPLPAEFWPEARLLKGERLLSKDAVDVILRTHTGHKRALSITGAPLISPDQKVTGAVLVSRDVTERRQLERQTQESLQSLLILAEALVSLPTTDEEASTTGVPISPIELVAKRLVVLIRSVLGCKRVSLTAYDPQTQKLRSVAVIGLPAEQELRWRGRNPGFRLSDLVTEETLQTQFHAGNPIVVDMNKPPLDKQPNTYGITNMLLVPMHVENRLVGILSLDHGGEPWQFQDSEKQLAKAVAELAALIIERERLLEERTEAQASVLALQETNLLKDEFIGIAGHELRTPLTTIKASVQLARRQVTRLSKQEQGLSPEASKLISSLQTLLDRAERQVGMQNRLVNDLLDISRIETGKLELHPALHDLITLVREVVEDQQALTPERQLLFEPPNHEEVLVLIDADRLRQVVTNYLTNALKYSETEKSVMIRVTTLDSQACVEIEDKGPGLTLVQQQHIWERFYRVPGIEVRSGSGVGLGLGLHISRMIIERQNGQVGLWSLPGEGSTFWFRLPLAE